MIRLLSFGILCTVLLSASSCDGKEAPVAPDNQTEQPSQNEQTATTMKVTIGNKVFTASIEDSATGRAFAALLPLTLDMSELNGNEKYHYLSGSLPTAASNPGTIHAGDFMLYGNNCIVLFYKTFQTSYRYTRIGWIDNPDGLANAVGSGSVKVKFE